MRYSIWLQAVLLPGSNKANSVLKLFGTAERVYNSDIKVLRASRLLSPRELERAEKIKITYADGVIDTCMKNAIGIITIADTAYPEALRNIPNPPLVLYTKGEFPDFDENPSVCIVGPRKVSDFGEKSAYSLALRLAKAGITIVSGCAVGSDSAAHIGALKCHGKTVGILPCGLMSDYLIQNKNLRAEIAKNGCLISEYSPETGVGPASFQIRNRLLAALVQSVVVVEASQKSGSLITARYACDYGKELFVIPGNPTYPQYKGSNALLRDGARPLIDVTDIFNEYISRFADKIDLEKAFKSSEKSEEKPKSDKKVLKNLPLGLSKEAKMLYNQLNRQKFSADDLLGSGLDDDELLSALTELEMEHLIKAVAGGMYEKITD